MPLFSNLTGEMLCKSLVSQFFAHIFYWNNEPCIVDPNETNILHGDDEERINGPC